jgi:hypothetical protein
MPSNREKSRRAPARGCRYAAFVLASVLLAAGCSSDPSAPESMTAEPPPAAEESEGGALDTADARVDEPPPDAGALDVGAPAPPVTAEALLAKLATCTKVSKAPYAKDVGGAANIDVCGLVNAVFFRADMDVDCDGKASSICSKTTDPSYQSQTAATDSKGAYLDAATLPYVVVPGVSSRWSYKTSGIAMGSVVAVIYAGKVEYGIVGDVGPVSILGEASYAMAKNLGINPNPATGGVSDGVTYVFFTGASGRVPKNEDHAEAVRVGQLRAAQLLTEN